MNSAFFLGWMTAEALSSDNTPKVEAPKKEVYDWGEMFEVKFEAIVSSFYARHHEVDRDVPRGKICNIYPDIDDAIGVIDRLSQEGSISPDQYLTITRGLLNF